MAAEEGEADELAPEEETASPSLMLQLLAELHSRVPAGNSKPSPLLLKLVLRAFGLSEHCGAWLRQVVAYARVDNEIVLEARLMGVSRPNLSFLEAVQKRQLESIKHSFLPDTAPPVKKATNKAAKTANKPKGKGGKGKK